MARHNRQGSGSDQRGYEYTVSYQPDWVRWIKVTRALESGRQSTKTLFKNAGGKEQEPGKRVRTRITSADQELDFEITVEDPKQVVKSVVVETLRPDASEQEGRVVFTIQDEMGPPENGDG